MLELWSPDKNIARFIDHTLLKPGATTEEIDRLCQEAMEHHFYSVCVNGSWVSYCTEKLAGTDVAVSAVVGFPLGAMSTKVKVFEAAEAVEDGAAEIDMVLPIGALLEGRYGFVANDIGAVVRAVEGSAIVKVIFETGMLNDEQKSEACRVAEAAGAHYVKTSTGFGVGGATEADIRLMRKSVTPGIGVKASGGIRSRETALVMLNAGATRLGTSAGVAIVTEAGSNASSTPASSTAAEPGASTPY
ncbi:deoxyribose-phosphate aldolase [Paenibacillus cellulosilyticus]|uniref:Deoxyribose-phosphate aldolase n=1 Tax=Paenibacillus cellulosilyticus TaxID=375489 RepID=A0A2V2YPQ9_9BACL|nr:deoxyribose-phosphate aldolase [Paenibacillus cellulosilyticus]PWV98374.1 deoxyribose-phosphate aldolase [Paenibacillus cellulosilyticus]QKS43225.1 deoxyribose-phosphate aldolase [Paenibacillus cellulosilyticus]